MKKIAYDLVTFVILPGIIAIERQIFFLTGCKLPILAAYWKHQAAKMQKRLDLAHWNW